MLISFSQHWIEISLMAVGLVLMTNMFGGFVRGVGSVLFVAGLSAGFSSPALADQSLTVEDNGSVDCVASSRDLTRISLVGDEFSSVSKVQTDDPLQDFNVVNEPTRGDIYLGIPEGFKRKSFSFFGTSKKGFVYKISCQVQDVDAQQIFLSNEGVRMLDEQTVAVAEDEEAPDLEETAIRLVQGMASGGVVPGFRYEASNRVPVKRGDLNVQLNAQYEGSDLLGQKIRVENLGAAPVALDEAMVAPADALAVSIEETQLAENQATWIYVVFEKRRTF